MFNQRGLRPVPMNFNMQDGMIDIDNNTGNIDIDFAQTGQLNANNTNMPAQAQTNVMQQPIIEPLQERVVQRTIMHEVPHVCPIRTKIINNHVYKHTYRPEYSCCEENTCTNVNCGSCCNY